MGKYEAFSQYSEAGAGNGPRTAAAPAGREPEGPIQIAGRPRVHAQRPHRTRVSGPQTRPDHIDIDPADQPELERAGLRLVEARKAGQGPVEEIDPMISRGIDGLPEGGGRLPRSPKHRDDRDERDRETRRLTDHRLLSVLHSEDPAVKWFSRHSL